MSNAAAAAEGAPPAFVSTGHLPGPDRVETLVDEAHARFRDTRGGEVSEVYPALAGADPDAFGICLAAVDGRTYGVGDVDARFAIMSVSKPFTFALLCDAVGPTAARDAIGVNATGLSFNSIEAVERRPGGRTNPMVNPGAIATVAAWAATVDDDPWTVLLDHFGAFAGHPLELDEDTYRCATDTNLRNRALTELLDSLGLLAVDSATALDLYTRQCCLDVSARDLAAMGATLAHGGVHPATGRRVISATACRSTLAVMATAGMYETSGEWLYEVGLPAKSGIGGGIVTVSPGKGALGTYSPPLDPAGNSVRGQAVAAHLARSLGLDLFASNDD